MSHEIYELDKTIAAVNPVWHGLSKILPERCNVNQAIEHTGLSWQVEKEPVFANCGDEDYFAVEDKFFTVRNDLPKTDHRRILGVVGKKYNPIQNTEAFTVIDKLVDISGGVVETAGSLMNGKIVWLLVHLPEEKRVKDDKISQYLLVSNKHDGTMAMTGLFTGVRVVCNNTLTVALNGAKTGVSIRHTKNSGAQINEAKHILAEANKYFGRIVDMYELLANTKIDKAFVSGYLTALFPDKDDEPTTRTLNIRESISTLYNKSQIGLQEGQEAIRGTAYGLFQATTQYIDHHMTSRTSEGDDKRESKMRSVIYGAGAMLRQKSFNLICRGIGTDNNMPLTEQALVTN